MKKLSLCTLHIHVRITSLTIARLMSDNVNAVIRYIMINFQNELEWFSMSR